MLILDNRSFQLDLTEKAGRNFLIKLLSITIHIATAAMNGILQDNSKAKRSRVYFQAINQCAAM